jgi:hypothetical protein
LVRGRNAPAVGERVFVERDVDEIDMVLDGSMIRCAVADGRAMVEISGWTLKATFQGWNKGDT